jgi:hypothetical protein
VWCGWSRSSALLHKPPPERRPAAGAFDLAVRAASFSFRSLRLNFGREFLREIQLAIALNVSNITFAAW